MRRWLVAGTTVLAYAVLYAPQPLLPDLAARYGVGESRAALLVTATLLPLSVAPVSYGLLLGRVPPLRVLRWALAALGVLQLAFAAADHFPAMLLLRALIGVALPAVLTALMTYVARSAAPGAVQRDMAGYVAASILGGFLGRAVAAVGAAVVDWRVVLGALGVALLAAVPLLGRLPQVASPPAAPAPRAAGDATGYARVYLMVFCLFFVFAGLLNFLPFRLAELRGGRTGPVAGLIYTGYLMGIAAALGSGRVARALGGERRALLAGLAALVASLALTLGDRVVVLFLALFAFCGAMFLVHALATGLVNRASGARAGMANALYLVFYYAGGVAGSYLPGLAYERHGWGALVATLAAVGGAGWLAAASGPLVEERAAARR